MKRRTLLALAAALGAPPLRAALPEGAAVAGWPQADLLLLGEQHDARAHQQLSARVTAELARQGRLAALALEMAERGRETAALARDADEAAVRAALAWHEAGWPWAAYGPIAMAAVRAGVPVHGANLPRAAMREAMADAALDAAVPAPVYRRLQADVRDGHCGLLPEERLPGMTRIQIARDRAMAEALRSLAMADRRRDPAQSGRVVLLVTGANHADATRGVPLHLIGSGLVLHGVRLAAGAAIGERTAGFDETWPTPPLPAQDHCAELRRQLDAGKT